MHNVVDFRPDRSQARSSIGSRQEGAQILLFTGVRYEREEPVEAPPFVPEAMPFEGACASERSGSALDLAAH